MPYTMWTANNTPIGGVMPLPANAGASPYWLAHITVPDVDATVTQTESLGGKTIEKATDIPTVGRYAILADPEGAVFSAFAPVPKPPQPEKDPEIGEFSWHELAANDYAKAFAFYQTTFGWEKVEEHDMGPMGIYLIFGRDGRQSGGMFNRPASMNMPANWLHYIRVASADRGVEVVKANGGTVLNGPMDVPGGDRIAQCVDPQGAMFAIHAKKT
jgi:predicted enzyme related to lactoylglutathione lyase